MHHITQRYYIFKMSKPYSHSTSHFYRFRHFRDVARTRLAFLPKRHKICMNALSFT
jgi:hypothetical protein